jgi:hypothetical protein
MTKRFANREAQPIFIRGDSDQMDVVGHQAVPPYVDSVLGSNATSGQGGLIVAVIEKSPLPPVATLSDMVWIACHHYPWDSRHETAPSLIDCEVITIKYGVPGILSPEFDMHHPWA